MTYYSLPSNYKFPANSVQLRNLVKNASPASANVGFMANDCFIATWSRVSRLPTVCKS